MPFWVSRALNPGPDLLWKHFSRDTLAGGLQLALGGIAVQFQAETYSVDWRIVVVLGLRQS